MVACTCEKSKGPQRRSYVAELLFSGHQCIADRLRLGFVVGQASLRFDHCYSGVR